MNKKVVSCNLCGSGKYNLLFVNYDHLSKNKQAFNIVQCKKCGLVYLNPRPSQMESYYLDSYDPHNPRKSDTNFSIFRALMISFYKNKKTLTDLFKSVFCQMIYSPPTAKCGRVLDVGCGNGGYLSVLNDCGWEVYGVDFSKKAVRYAQNERGLNNVKQAKAEKLDFIDNFFGLVMMNHLIEHLQNPKDSLLEAKRVLKKGGILVITTPNFSSLNSRIFGKNWFPLETPRHLFLFDTYTIKKMIESIEGLKISRIKHDYSAYCLAKSLGYFLGNRLLINHLLMTVKIIFWPYTILLSLFGLSDITTFYINKK